MSEQLQLLEVPRDRPILGAGSLRNWVGLLCEEIVCAGMGWERLTTAGACKGETCPDAVTPLGSPVEVKSVRVGNTGAGHSTIYDFRLTRDLCNGVDGFYTFVGHSGRLADAHMLSDIFDYLENQLLKVVVVPAEEVRRAARRAPKGFVKRKAGYGKRVGYVREGYRDGFRRVPVGRWMRALDTGMAHHAEAEVEGRRFEFAYTYL